MVDTGTYEYEYMGWARVVLQGRGGKLQLAAADLMLTPHAYFLLDARADRFFCFGPIFSFLFFGFKCANAILSPSPSPPSS